MLGGPGGLLPQRAQTGRSTTVLGHAALGPAEEKGGFFPRGLGGCKASNAWSLPLQHTVVEALSAHQIKEFVLMSAELHPFVSGVSDLGLARDFPVFASRDLTASPPMPAWAVLYMNFFNLTLLHGKFVTTCSSLLLALKNLLGQCL